MKEHHQIPPAILKHVICVSSAQVPPVAIWTGNEKQSLVPFTALGFGDSKS